MNKIKESIIKAGKAMLAVGLQNTHCGNISVRVNDEIFITKTGSMKGHLKETDIVEPGLYEPKFGLFQASSETGTHQKILEYAGSAIHAHSIPATLLSYITEVINPIDLLGKKYLGSIPVVAFEYPVGSKEMEETIPRILKNHPAMVIKTHGPMIRGSNVFESLFLLNISDYSSEILLYLSMLKVDRQKIPRLNYPRIDAYVQPPGKKDTKDEELIKQFKKVAGDMFKMRISPIHTGSISVQDGKEMLFSPLAATPRYIENDIYRIRLNEPFTDYFYQIHQAVYNYSHCQSAVFTHSPYAVIQGFWSLSRGEDRIIPLDAEGGYLYPAVPIVSPDENIKNIIKNAERYKMVLIAGMGVLAVGHTPAHCIHHNSSLKNISYLKTQLAIMEQAKIIKNIDQFLDVRGKEW